jgi:hypothetical protein
MTPEALNILDGVVRIAIPLIVTGLFVACFRR